MDATPTPSSRHSWAVAVIFLVVVDMVFIGRALVTDDVRAPVDLVTLFEPLRSASPDVAPPHNPLLSDWALQFWPWQGLVRRAWRDGRVPLWNDLNGSGQPLAANMQCEAFSPYLPLSLVFEEQYPDVKQLVQLLIAQCGVLWLCARLRLSAGAAILGALAYSFHSYCQTWAVHPHSGSAAFGPWILLGLMEARRGARRGWAAAAAALALSVLAGHIETAFLCAMGASFVAFIWTPSEAAGLRRRARFALTVLCVGIAGLALAAVQVLPFLEYLGQSDVQEYRAAQPVRTLPLAQLATVFDPFAFGDPTRPERPWIGASNFVEGTFFAGRLALGLALVGVLAGVRRHLSLIVGSAVTIGIGLLVSYAPSQWATVLERLPPFDRMPTARTSFIAALPIAVLAAAGMDALLTALRGAPRRRWTALIAIPLLAATEAVVTWHDWVPTTPASRLAVPAELDDAMTPLRGGGGRCLPVGGLLPPELNAACDVPSLRGYDAVLPRRHFRWLLRSGAFYGLNFAQSAVFCDPDLLDATSTRWLLTTWPAAEACGVGDVTIVAPGRPIEVHLRTTKGARLESVLFRRPGAGIQDGTIRLEVESTGDVRQDERLTSRVNPPAGRFGRLIVEPDAAAADLVHNNFRDQDAAYFGFEFSTDAEDVTLRLSVVAEAEPVTSFQVVRGGLGTGLEERSMVGRLRLTERTSAMPRAYFGAAPRFVDGFESALDAFMSRDFDPRAVTIVEGAAPLADAIGAAAASQTGSAEYRRVSPEEVVVTTVADGPRLLVVTDLWFPGWRAELDGGTDLEMFPVNVSGRGVLVPAGEHAVRFTYRPWSVVVGASVSGLAALGIAVFCLRRRR